MRWIIVLLLSLSAPVLVAGCDCKVPTTDATPPMGQELAWGFFELSNQNATTAGQLDAINLSANFYWADISALAAENVLVQILVYVDGDPAGTNLGNGVFDGVPNDTLVADINTATLGLPSSPGTGGGAVGVNQTLTLPLTFTQAVDLPPNSFVSRRFFLRAVFSSNATAFQAARDDHLDIRPFPTASATTYSVSGIAASDLLIWTATADTFNFGKRSLGGCPADTCSAGADCSVRADGRGVQFVWLIGLVLIAAGVRFSRPFRGRSRSSRESAG